MRQVASTKEVAVDRIQPGEEAEVVDAVDVVYGAQAIGTYAIGWQEELGVVSIVRGDESWWEVGGRCVARVGAQALGAIGSIQVGVGVPGFRGTWDQGRHGVPRAAVGARALEALLRAACRGAWSCGRWKRAVGNVSGSFYPVGQGRFQKVFRQRCPDGVNNPRIEGHVRAPIFPKAIHVLF